MRNVDGQTGGGAPFGEAPGRTGAEEYVTLSLGDLLRVLWRRMWAIALVALLLAGAVLAYELLVETPDYEASIKVIIGQREDGGGTSSGLGSQVQGLQDLTVSMTEVVETRSVAEAVIRRLDLPTTPGDFSENLKAVQVPNTQIIEVSYRDPDPERARRAADAVGTEFSEKISSISEDVNAVTATVLEPAVTPQEPVDPEPLRDGLLALVLGAMLGIGLAFLLEHLDDGWRSPEEVEEVSGVPTFGVIPAFEAPGAKKGGAAGG